MPYLMALKALPWKLIGLCALGLFIAGLFAALKLEQAHSAKLSAQLHECSTLRHADRESYARAQAEAQAKNADQIAKIEQRQKEVSDETVALLNDRLARLRSELSKGGAAAPQSHPAGPGASASGAAPGGASGQAGVCISPEELLRAAENEERHDRLIDWVIGQSKVEPSN